jgi:predicted MFS family arabinose efflux permease
LSGYRWVIFGLGASLFLLSMFYRASSAIIAPDLARDLSLDYETLGLLGASFYYTFALIQLPMGLIMDRIGPRLTMAGLNLLGTVGALVFAFSGGAAAAVTGRALLGLGMAANLIGPLSLFSRWFRPDRFATIQGLLLAVGNLGGIMAATPLALAAGALGWRTTFMALAGLNLALIATAFLFLRDNPPGNEPDPLVLSTAGRPGPGIGRSLAELLGSRDYWLIGFSAFLRYGTYAAIQGLWAGPFLIERLGYDPVKAGNLLLLLNLGFIIGAPVIGRLSETYIGSRKRTVVAGIAVMAGAVLCLGLWPGSLPAAVLAGLLFLLGFTSSAGNIMYVHIKSLMPVGMTSTAMAGINFFTMAGAGAFSQGIGRLLESLMAGGGGKDPYQWAFLSCALALGLVVVLYLLTRDETRPDGKDPGSIHP